MSPVMALNVEKRCPLACRLSGVSRTPHWPPAGNSMTKIDLDAYFSWIDYSAGRESGHLPSERNGRRHDRAALLAGSEFLRTVKIAISLRHRICAIVIYNVGLLMQ